MQDNPPPPSDNQEHQEQSQPNLRTPEEARTPENTTSPSPKEPVRPQSPQGEEDVDLRRYADLRYAQRFYASDSDSRSEDGTPEPNAPFKQEFEKSRVWFRKSAGRELYPHRDHLTRYERGMEMLREQLPNQHPARPAIEILCERLTENIEFVRINKDFPEKEADRMTIIGELHIQSLNAIEVSFYKLCHITGPDDERGEAGSDLPQTQAEVAEWYTNLNWFERCYVIAACVLQDAPSHEVSRAANELHSLIESASPLRQSGVTDERSMSHATTGPVFISAEEMLTHTYTVTEKHYGAERIMWRDEAFDPLVREFLARQTTTVGMRFANRDLLDILEEWVVSGNEERAFRAGRVLADLWWRQHQDKVLKIAETWARSDDENIWQGGAALLYGAFVAECAERPAMKATDSEVLHRLREWADWREDAEMAQVAAYAYGLIGRQWPEIALDGLDHLLCLGASARVNNATPPLPVIFLAMLSYMELAISGQVRPLLKRFASHATHYIGNVRHTNRSVFEDEQSHAAREHSLDMLFFHIVFLVALSLDGVRQGKGHESYLTNVRLPPYPDLPSSRGQDVLLAGVLSKPEQEWRTSVQTLFCVAISSGREQFVFEILASWIRIVTYEPHGDATEGLLRFVADMHQQLRSWDDDQKRRGIWAGNNLLEQRLLFWTKATREIVLRPFAQRALDALHK
jgi:hypothetical protein